ncbi:hypothetical protein Egran_00472 [Elaphomyces granulatus]|uniref:Nucleic acid-binding protein n=1 Tax=Elaphomyces granulatus TaxID=519963 RepID=A0A232M5V9_9EURO|nr:hypothetical protein Egran_00472 [Elaphomyces granulatus]
MLSPSNPLLATRSLRASLAFVFLPSSIASSLSTTITRSVASCSVLSARISKSSLPVQNRRRTTSPPFIRASSTSSSSPSSIATALPSVRKYPYSLNAGTVVSAGRMDRTVRVMVRHTIWDAHIRKYYPKETTYMVSDPRNSLREGDVIEFSSGAPKSRRVRHVVERIIAPFGVSIEERPTVMSREEREEERARKRAEKLQRREQRTLSSGEKTRIRPGHREHVGKIKRMVMERIGRGDALTATY